MTSTVNTHRTFHIFINHIHAGPIQFPFFHRRAFCFTGHTYVYHSFTWACILVFHWFFIDVADDLKLRPIHTAVGPRKFIRFHTSQRFSHFCKLLGCNEMGEVLGLYFFHLIYFFCFFYCRTFSVAFTLQIRRTQYLIQNSKFPQIKYCLYKTLVKLLEILCQFIFLSFIHSQHFIYSKCNSV